MIEQLNQNMKSIDDFFNLNSLDKCSNRDKHISEILDQKIDDSSVFFERGHIDKIDNDGNFCGNGGKEILEYVELYIQKNIQKHTSIQKKFESLGVGNYIDNSISDEDFWNKILK